MKVVLAVLGAVVLVVAPRNSTVFAVLTAAAIGFEVWDFTVVSVIVTMSALIVTQVWSAAESIMQHQTALAVAVATGTGPR